jgi:hypothetical protein
LSVPRPPSWRRLIWRAVVACTLLVVGSAVAPRSPEPEPASASVEAPAQAVVSWSNPLNPPAPARNPFVLRSGSTYYAYVSGFDYLLAQYGARVFQSSDLVNWTSMGNALPLGTAGAWTNSSSGYNFTSPSVREIGTNPPSQRFVMYFTGIQASSGSKCIGVATSSSPTGPFTGAANPLICPTGGAQDPSAIVVPDGTGFQEVVYRKNAGGDAGIYNQVLSADGLSLGSGWSPFLLYKAQPNWWHEGVAERPAVLADAGGNAYLVFSGGPANTAARAVGWSPCSHLGVIVSCQNQTSLGTWIAGTSQVGAPNGAQPFTDAGGRQWLVYDGFASGQCSGTSGPCTGNPTMRIDKLCYAHGQPRTNAPTVGSQTRAAAPASCSADIPGASLSVASATDDGTLLGTTAAPLQIDGVASGAAGGKVLWGFGDTFTCPGGLVNNSGGFGPPAAAADGPNYVQHNCDELVPLTATEAAYQVHSCTPPAGGSCQLRRFTMWSAGIAGLPDGGAAVPFSKVRWINTLTDGDGNPNTAPTESGWQPTALGVGLARVTAANVAAGIPVADRSVGVSPAACGGGAVTAAGCLFDEGVSPTSNSDRFWRPVVDGGHLYLFSDLSWNAQGQFTGNTKVARAPLASIDTPSAWRYWTGPGPDDWTSTNNYAQAVDVPGMQAGSVSYNPYLDKYINTWGDFGGGVGIQTANDLTGPWSAIQPLHDQVECGPGDVSYDGRLHPELSMAGGRQLVLVYFATDNGNSPTCVGGSRLATIRLG